jgi:hypothetical protein
LAIDFPFVQRAPLAHHQAAAAARKNSGGEPALAA